MSVFSSVPAPPDTTLLFAIGTSAGILEVDTNTNTTWLSPAPANHDEHPKDVFALEFLSEIPDVLLSGGRNGILNIIDHRKPSFGSNADVIIHPSSINHIKQLDTHRLIVSGLNSSLCQYDLRFRKTGASLPQVKQASKNNPMATKPILQYPDFWNNATIQIGFDVDLESGIVAAAQEQDEFHAPVQLFSLHGGHKLWSPYVSKNEHHFSENQPIVKSLSFVHEEGRMKSLWIGRGCTVERYLLDGSTSAPTQSADSSSPSSSTR